MYYVASSAGVATGPARGLRAGRGGRHALNLIVVIALSLVVGRVRVRAANAAGQAAVAGGGFGRLWSRHAVAASLALMIITAGHSTVYAFLPMHASAAGLGNAAWFFPLMSGCTIASRFVLRRASDQFGRARVLVPALVALALGNAVLAISPTIGSLIVAAVAARHRQLDALPHARRPGRRSHAGLRARAGDRHRCRGRGTSASSSARRSSRCWWRRAATPPASSPPRSPSWPGWARSSSSERGRGHAGPRRARRLSRSQ